MSDIALTPELLKRVARRNNFPVPSSGMVFVGIRGATPLDWKDHAFAQSRTIREADIDYRHMRCTFVQWRTEDGMLALFPGSTVPNQKSVVNARAGGAPANQVIPGCFSYLRGRHKGMQPSGHDAFRQNSFLPVQRSRDDDDFDLADAVDFARSAKAEDFVWDNIHAAYDEDPTTPGYSSQGCQVVCGFPSTTSGKHTERGPWKTFRQNAYDKAGGQQDFTYMLFEGAEIARVAANSDGALQQTVRYGSRGPLVGAVQAALVRAGFDIGAPDDKFGRNTLIALYEFQKRLFGSTGADCVVGPETARALGVEMPALSGATPAPAALATQPAVVAPAQPVGPISGIRPEAIPARFNAQVIAAAQASQARWGVPASITLAQWALESGYGRSMPAGSNNPFGIKARPGQPSVGAMTREEIDGRLVTVQQPFRKFASLDEAFIKHAELLGTSRHYARARMFGDDPDRFADALTGVYATDSGYGAKLKSIMRKNDLYRFDAPGAVVDGDDEDAVAEPITITRAQEGAAATTLQPGHTGPRVRMLQEALVNLGYQLGDIDGKLGSLTQAALLKFQADNHLPLTGAFDAATQACFDTARPRPLDPARVGATEEDLAARGSRVIKDARFGRVGGWIAAAFGALGIGNSAIIAGAGAGKPPGQMPDALLPFLVDVQRLTEPARATPAELGRIAELAKGLREGLGSGLSADTLQLIQQIRTAVPAEFLARTPDLQKFFDLAGATSAARPAGMSTVFDVLPTLFTNDTVLHTAMKGVAAVGASTLPGLGGSVAVMALGLFGRHLANRIAAARLEDHKTGKNIGR